MTDAYKPAMESSTPTLIIWRGSQFSMKAIAAFAIKGMLPERGVRMASVPNDLEKRKQILPAPYTVPALVWGDEVVMGTDDICAFLDSKLPTEHLLYPAGKEEEVRRLEAQCEDLYWLNGYTSLVDKEGFERHAGERARRFFKKSFGLVGRSLLWVAPGKTNGLITGFVAKEWRATVRRRGGDKWAHLAKEDTNDADVIAETRDALRALEAEYGKSSSSYFCEAESPTAADLTLYGMLERWMGNSLMEGVHGPAQPTILDGLPKMAAAWEAMSTRFERDCSLRGLQEYKDLTAHIGEATWSAKKKE